MASYMAPGVEITEEKLQEKGELLVGEIFVNLDYFKSERKSMIA